MYLLQNKTLSVLVIHCKGSEHNFYLKNVALIKIEIILLGQKFIESTLISESFTKFLYQGSYNIPHSLINFLLLQFGIFKNSNNKNKSTGKENEIS